MIREQKKRKKRGETHFLGCLPGCCCFSPEKEGVGVQDPMGNNNSAQAAFDKAQSAVEAATGSITKCMSKDSSTVIRVCAQHHRHHVCL